MMSNFIALCFHVLHFQPWHSYFFTVPATERLKWYQKGWVLALLGLATALLLLICIGLVLRRFSGGLNVYVRESTPLPRRSKSKMGTQASTRSSDAISERRLPYIGTPAQSRHVRKICTIAYFLKISPTSLHDG